MDNAEVLKQGKCKIKPGAINKLGKNIKLKFGRGKNFDYTYILTKEQGEEILKYENVAIECLDYISSL